MLLQFQVNHELSREYLLEVIMHNAYMLSEEDLNFILSN